MSMVLPPAGVGWLSSLALPRVSRKRALIVVPVLASRLHELRLSNDVRPVRTSGPYCFAAATSYTEQGSTARILAISSAGVGGVRCSAAAEADPGVAVPVTVCAQPAVPATAPTASRTPA